MKEQIPEKRPRPATTSDQVNIPENEVRPWKKIGLRHGVSVRVVAWEDESYVHEYLDEQGRVQLGAHGVVPKDKTRVEIRYPSLQALAEFRREISQWRVSQITLPKADYPPPIGFEIKLNGGEEARRPT